MGLMFGGIRSIFDAFDAGSSAAQQDGDADQQPQGRNAPDQAQSREQQQAGGVLDTLILEERENKAAAQAAAEAAAEAGESEELPPEADDAEIPVAADETDAEELPVEADEAELSPAADEE